MTASDVHNVANIQSTLFSGDNHPVKTILLRTIAPPNQEIIKGYRPADDSGVVTSLLFKAFNKLFDSAKELCEQCGNSAGQFQYRESTIALLATKPNGKEQKRLVRLILEDCFPDGIRKLPGLWETPESWLGKQRPQIPSIEAIRELAPNVASWLMLEALCMPASPEEDLLRGILPIVGNLEEKVTETLTRKEWFEQLASLLQKPDESYAIFSQCLERHWGPLITETKTSKGINQTLNFLTFTALCASRIRMWFDPKENAFYWYRPKYGTWTFLTENETKRLILEWMLIQRDIPEASPNLQTVEQVVKHLKIIALYERTESVATPVHLADGMLYLEDEVKQCAFSPAYFSKNRIPISYDPTRAEQNAMFVDFLERSLPQDDIDLLQLWCGHVLLGKNSEHRILLIRGTGGTGKSTLMDIIEAVIGPENVASLNVERLDDRFELAAFRDKTLLIGKDVASDVLQTRTAHTLKALSGDRGIEAELKHENQRFKLSGPFNIALTSNSDLQIGLRGDAEAWERRLLVIDFNIRPAKKILDYASQIIASSPEGILNWMLRGAEKASAGQRFCLSPRQGERLKRLLGQSSSTDSFVESCLESKAGTFVTTDALFKSYIDFCNEQVLHPLEETVFQRRIRVPLFQKHGARADENLTNTNNKKCRGYKPLAIKPHDEWPRPYKTVVDSVKQFEVKTEDILDCHKIQARVRSSTDEAVKWVFANVTSYDRTHPKAGPSSEAKLSLTAKSIIARFNIFISHDDYSSETAKSALAKIRQRTATRALLEQQPKHMPDIRKLKRHLLEDIFPEELRRMPGDESAAESNGHPNNTDNTNF